MKKNCTRNIAVTIAWILSFFFGVYLGGKNIAPASIPRRILTPYVSREIKDGDTLVVFNVVHGVSDSVWVGHLFESEDCKGFWGP